MHGLITPRAGAGVCPVCFNFTRERSGRCRACLASESHLAAVAPISYAAAGSSLHRALADYKRAADPSVPYLAEEIAAILSSFLAEHEGCVAARAGVTQFDCVTVVPSSQARRDVGHPLRRIVSHDVPEVRGRYRDALGSGEAECIPHHFDRRRFVALHAVGGKNVLLIDDIWTTGANAQSAAAALRTAGAASVAAIVVGRYVNGSWGGIDERLAGMAESSDPARCAVCRETHDVSAQRRPGPADHALGAA